MSLTFFERSVAIRDVDGLVDLATGQVLPLTPPPPIGEPAFVLGATMPTATNTGLVDPAALTRFDGTISTSSNAQVIQNLDIYGRISVAHTDVVIRNCIVRGLAVHTFADACITATNVNVRRLLVDRCLLVPQTPSRFTNGIDGHDFTLRRTHIRDVVDYFGLFNTQVTRVDGTYPLNVRIEGVYGERMAYFTPDPAHTSDNQSHNDGVQFQGGQGAVVIGSRLRAVYGPAGTHQPIPGQPTPSGWPNPSLAVLLFNNNVGTTGLHAITDNWFEGGHLPINVGGAAGQNLGVIHRNRFDGTHTLAGSPLSKRSDQTIDYGFGTANTNVFYSGIPITTARAA